MGLFRRQEPLHERLAREGVLVERPPAPVDPRPHWQEIGVHGIARPREWDVTVTADAPDVEGDAARFVALPDGALLVEEGPEAIEPLAAAVEQELRAPYRARAARQDGTLWALQARRIEVLDLPEAPGGEVIELTHSGDETQFSVDGQRTFGTLPALAERGAREAPDYAVRAERLDGDLWEIRAAAL